MAAKKVTQTQTCPENKIIPSRVLDRGDISDLKRAQAGLYGFMTMLEAAGDEYYGLFELLTPHMETIDQAINQLQENAAGESRE